MFNQMYKLVNQHSKHDMNVDHENGVGYLTIKLHNKGISFETGGPIFGKSFPQDAHRNF